MSCFDGRCAVFGCPCGAEPHVVMVTNGDYACHDHSVGYARLRETLTGVEMLGFRMSR
ncbi:MAG: hypothetical protein ACLVJ6_08435 [Merdibacter sp.]